MERMRTCPDYAGNIVNRSVKRGWDSAMLSFVSGSKLDSEDFPCIRIFVDTEEDPIPTVQTEKFISKVHLLCYCLFNYGHDEEVSFEEYRDAYIRTNTEWLRETNGFNPREETMVYGFDNPQTISKEHTQAYRSLIGSDVIIKPPYYVSRFDLNLWVNNFDLD